MRIICILFLLTQFKVYAQSYCDCENEYQPVCSIMGNTFANACLAACNGENFLYEGECVDGNVEYIKLNYYKGWHYSYINLDTIESVKVFEKNDSLKGLYELEFNNSYAILAYFVGNDKNYKETIVLEIRPENNEPFYIYHHYAVLEGLNPLDEFCHPAQLDWIKSVTNTGGECKSDQLVEINWYGTKFYRTGIGAYQSIDNCVQLPCPADIPTSYLDVFGNTVCVSAFFASPFRCFSIFRETPQNIVWDFNTNYPNPPNLIDTSFVKNMIENICISDIYTFKHNNFIFAYGVSECDSIDNQLFNYTRWQYQKIHCASLENEIKHALTAKNLIWSNHQFAKNCNGISIENFTSYCEDCSLKIGFDILSNDSLFTITLEDGSVIQNGSVIDQEMVSKWQCLDFNITTSSGCNRKIAKILPIGSCCENSDICKNLNIVRYDCNEGLQLNGVNGEQCKNINLSNFHNNQIVGYGTVLEDDDYLLIVVDSIKIFQDSSYLYLSDTTFFNLKIDCDTAENVTLLDESLIKKHRFKLSPNPVNNHLIIKFEGM